MAQQIAVFDLDRTLLRGSSTPAISRALAQAGLSGRRGVPGQALMVRAYDLVGETVPSMALARSAVLAARGKPVAEVRRAAEVAADELERQVLPWAPQLLDEHRRAGRLLLLATTTPADLVRPLATRLGFDDLVATTYQRRPGADGVERYNGRLEGGFTWGVGKLVAVRRWARQWGADLEGSWAYSDSVYDLPLLASVGHPTAVNPDPRLLAVALTARWPVLHLDAPPGVPKLFGVEPLDLLRFAATPAAFPYARFDIAGTEHIPRRGPVVLASNHRSYFDVAAWAITVVQAGRRPRGLGKKELLDAPVVGPLLRACGVIRVDRQGGGAQAFVEAEHALRAGELLIIAPQATIPRGAAFFDPVLRGKTGAARLAAATGAPVVPLGLWNTEAVWARSSRLPSVTNVLDPPTVRVRVGRPVSGLDGDPVADTARIMDAITALLPPEAALARQASPDELARTLPPGMGSAPGFR